MCPSQDTLVTFVYAAVSFDFTLVCDPGTSLKDVLAEGHVPIAKTLPGQKFATSSCRLPLKEDPHYGEGTEKLVKPVGRFHNERRAEGGGCFC